MKPTSKQHITHFEFKLNKLHKLKWSIFHAALVHQQMYRSMLINKIQPRKCVRYGGYNFIDHFTKSDFDTQWYSNLGQNRHTCIMRVKNNFRTGECSFLFTTKTKWVYKGAGKRKNFWRIYFVVVKTQTSAEIWGINRGVSDFVSVCLSSLH